MKLKKAVMILESQPPHMGEFLQILVQLGRFDFMYVCLNFTHSLMPESRVLAIWKRALEPYDTKLKIVKVPGNFATVAKDELPKLFDGCAYLTTEKIIFVHLSSMNVPVELIPRALGYSGIFIRSAYRQSNALDWLEAQTVNSVIGIK